jgi:hypothetical protein
MGGGGGRIATFSENPEKIHEKDDATVICFTAGVADRVQIHADGVDQAL